MTDPECWPPVGRRRQVDKCKWGWVGPSDETWNQKEKQLQLLNRFAVTCDCCRVLRSLGSWGGEKAWRKEVFNFLFNLVKCWSNVGQMSHFLENCLLTASTSLNDCSHILSTLIYLISSSVFFCVDLSVSGWVSGVVGLGEMWSRISFRSTRRNFIS